MLFKEKTMKVVQKLTILSSLDHIASQKLTLICSECSTTYIITVAMADFIPIFDR